MLSPQASALTSCDLDVDVETPQGGVYVAGTIAIEWTVSGADADAAVSDVDLLDADGLLTTLASDLDGESTSWDTTAYADAPDYRIAVEATALCGSATDTTAEFTVDNTAPARYAIDAPSAGDIVGGDVPVDWTGDEKNKGDVQLETSGDGGSSWQTLTSSTSDDGSHSLDTTTLADGTYQLRLTPTDLADNVGASATTDDFDVDNTAPTVTVDDLDDTVRGVTEITWSASDTNLDSVDILYSGDGTGTVATDVANDGSYDWDTTTVDDGDYQVTVEAHDVVGNLGDDVTSTFTVANEDSDAPDPSITSPKAGDVVDDDVTLQWDLPDDDLTGVVAEYSTDGGSTWTQFDSGLTETTSTTWDLSGIADQDDAHLRIVATDVDGLTGTSTIGPITVDRTPPDVTMSAPSDGTLIQDQVDVAWAADDVSSLTTRLELSDDGGDTWETVEPGLGVQGTTAWGPGPASQGSHQLRVTAVDAAGHVGHSDPVDVELEPVISDVQLQRPVPGSTLTGPPSQLQGTASSPGDGPERVEVQFVSPGGSYWSAAQRSWTPSPTWNLAQGTNEWSLDLETASLPVEGPYRVIAQAYYEGTNEPVVEASTVHFTSTSASSTETVGPCIGCAPGAPLPTMATMEARANQAAGWLPTRADVRCDEEGDGGSPPVGGGYDRPEETCRSPGETHHQLLQDILDAWENASGILEDPTLRCPVDDCGQVDNATAFVDQTGTDAIRAANSLARYAPSRTCSTVQRRTPACSTVAKAWNDPVVACGVAQEEIQTGGALSGSVSYDAPGQNGSASVGTRAACGAAVAVLANLCQAPADVSDQGPGITTPDGDDPGQEASRRCERRVGPLLDAGAEFFDVDCQGDDQWIEGTLQGEVGTQSHSASATFQQGVMRSLDVLWEADWENQQIACYQPLENLSTDFKSPTSEFPHAEICDASAFKVHVKGRYTGETGRTKRGRINFTVPDECIQETGTPTLFHYQKLEGLPDEWEALKTRSIGNASDGRFTAVTDDFSPFVFGYLPSSGPEGNRPPDAGFTASCPSGSCTFDATPSQDPDGTIVAYEWEIGDDVERPGREVTHDFPGPGRYQVRLTVEDNDGSRRSEVQEIRITDGNAGPKARFTVDCQDGRCTFDATGSTDSDGTVQSYEWKFDDGRQATGSTVQHTYDADGDYHVVLEIRDDDDATATRTRVVTVSGTAASPHDGGGNGADGTVEATEEDPGQGDPTDVLPGPLAWLAGLGRLGLAWMALIAAVAAGGLLGLWVRRRHAQTGEEDPP